MFAPRHTSEMALSLSAVPFLMMVVAAPFTTHRPWETTSTTSFGVSVLSVSTKFGTLASSSSWNVPSAACGKTSSTLGRPVPQVLVLTFSPNYPLMLVAYAPTTTPSGTLSARRAYVFTVFSPLATITSPMGSSFFTMPWTAAAASSDVSMSSFGVVLAFYLVRAS